MFKLKGNIYIEIQFSKTKISECFFCGEIIDELPFLTFSDVSGCIHDPVANQYISDGVVCGSRSYNVNEIHSIKFKKVE